LQQKNREQLLRFQYFSIKTIVFIFIISNQFCFGFQNLKVKTDSIAIYLEQNNSIKAINYAREKSNYYLNKKRYNDYCDIMLQKAELYEQFNDKENALKILFEARDIAEKYNLTEKKLLIYTYIGIINVRIIEYTKARKYLNKALKIATKLNNKDLLFKVNQPLFKLHFEIESDSATYFLNKIKSFTKNSNNLELLSKNHDNFYHYYISKRLFSLAKQQLDSALIFAIKLDNKKLIATTYNNLGIHYMTVENNFEKGEKYYQDIIKMFPNENEPSILGNAYLNLSYAYEKLGNYKKAYEYSNKYFDIQDELLNGRINQSNQEIETKYAINKIENEYKEKAKIIDQRQDRNVKILLLFISLFILAGFILYFYYQNLLLKQKNEIKDLDNKLQYKIISATLDGQDQERNKISGVLHDHVSAILSSVGLHLSAFENSISKEQIQELKKTKSLLKDAHDKVRDLSHELVPPLLVKFGLQYALSDLCEKNSNSILHFDYISGLSDQNKYATDFETKIYFIVSELLNNVMKHSNASKSVLYVDQINKQLNIKIEDNGIGFDVNQVNKTNGFGLTQIKARIKNMDGDMIINSKKKQGTIITIKVNI
jgi:signal transduction histidine kinase